MSYLPRSILKYVTLSSFVLLPVCSVYAQSVIATDKLIKAQNTTAYVNQAAYLLMTLGTDSDTDGYIEPPPMDILSSANKPLSGSGTGAGAGGLVPDLTGVPFVDGYNARLGYCAYDNGLKLLGNVGLLKGALLPAMTNTVFAVISSGEDQVFDTTCADAYANRPKGDDVLMTFTQAQAALGTSAAVSTYNWGPTVPTLAELNALPPGSLRLNEVRQVTGDNTLMTWNGTSWVSVSIARLANYRSISATGDAAWSISFDGSANASSALTLATTGVLAGTYGTSTTVPTLSVDAKGRVIAAALSPINFPVTSVNGATGAVVVSNITGNAGSATRLAAFTSISMSGDVMWTSAAFNGTANVTGSSTLSNTGVIANTYGSATMVPTFTVDSKGRLTAASSNAARAASVVMQDSRLIPAPANTFVAAGLFTDFKYNSTIGVAGGNYSGVMTVVPWGDDSGGGVSQLAFTDRANMQYRYGGRTTGFGAWQTIMSSDNQPYAWGMNQYVRTTDAPTFAGATVNGTLEANNLTISGNQVLHAGNYNSYAPSKTGAGASGTWAISVTGNAATATQATSSSYQSATGNGNDWVQSFQQTPPHSTSFREMSTGGPSGTWWMTQNLRHSNGSNYWGTQIAWGWEDNANTMYTRNITGGAFGSWVKYLNSSNVGSYAPSLTGTGASGSWNINVTGAAETANTVQGSYTGNGGTQPPAYIPGGKVRFNMMTGIPGTNGSYADWLMMDTYTGGDVPYVTMIGINKAAGAATGYLAVGAKGGSSWAATPIITGANIASQSVAWAANVNWAGVT